MKTIVRIMCLTLGLIMAVTILALNANAQCGPTDERNAATSANRLPQRFALSRDATQLASLKQLGRSEQGTPIATPSIVGLWHVKFVSEGTGFIPDGTVIDMGFAQWHSDGTEILNSSRPPATSNFCLGVWEKTGRYTYKLNHFALSSDMNGNLIGPANIRENVTLDPTGRTYSGTFSIDQFDLNGNNLAHITGNVSATRLTVDSTPAELF